MNDTTRLESQPNHRRRRYRWCCSFSTPPLSPENPTEFRSHSSKKMELPSNSPQKLPLARRILSPGRVSPIPDDPSIFHATPKERTPSKPPMPAQNEGNLGIFYVRLSLEGRNGESLILELDSEILATNSSIFADLITDYRKNLSGGLCKIEVPDVENLNVFRETIELMLEVDIQKKLLKIGVLRAIDILEVLDHGYPWYNVSECLFVEQGFNCLANGRIDEDYLKWRWKPKNCDIPRVNVRVVLEKLRNKRVVVVGDSMSRTQWESLICFLMTGLEDKGRAYEVDGSKITKQIRFLGVRFSSFNLTVEFYRSVFLVQHKHAPKRVRSDQPLSWTSWMISVRSGLIQMF